MSPVIPMSPFHPLAPRKTGQSCSCSGAVPMLISWTMHGLPRSFPPPLRVGYCFGVSPLPASAFHEMHRNLIIFETYTPFQIWLRLASKLKTLLHVDRQRDYTNFISLGNQANRSNIEKYSRYINNTVRCSVSVKCEAVVTVKSSNRKKRSRKENKYFLFSATAQMEQAQKLPAGLNFGNLFNFF